MTDPGGRSGAGSVVVVREATLADSEPIAAMMSELGYDTTPAEMSERLAALLADESYATFVAEAGGILAGVVGVRIGRYYERNGVYGQLLVLEVEESRRGRGVGRALVQRAEAWSHARGAQAMVLHSGRRRAETHGFYQRVGYTDTGVRFVKALGRTERA